MQFENRSSAASNWQTLLFEWLDFVPDATMAERSREPTKLLETTHQWFGGPIDASAVDKSSTSHALTSSLRSLHHVRGNCDVKRASLPRHDAKISTMYVDLFVRSRPALRFITQSAMHFESSNHIRCGQFRFWARFSTVVLSIEVP